MKSTAILFPVIVQAFLTIVVLILMGPARARSLREQSKTISDPDLAIGRHTWSAEATKIANNYANQFEQPVLFYAVVAFTMLTGAVDSLAVALAWIFAVSRLVHAAIHIGPNVVMWRALAFMIGVVVLVIMWARLALHIL